MEKPRWRLQTGVPCWSRARIKREEASAHPWRRHTLQPEVCRLHRKRRSKPGVDILLRVKLLHCFYLQPSCASKRPNHVLKDRCESQMCRSAPKKQYAPFQDYMDTTNNLIFVFVVGSEHLCYVCVPTVRACFYFLLDEWSLIRTSSHKIFIFFNNGMIISRRLTKVQLQLHGDVEVRVRGGSWTYNVYVDRPRRPQQLHW